MDIVTKGLDTYGPTVRQTLVAFEKFGCAGREIPPCLLPRNTVSGISHCEKNLRLGGYTLVLPQTN